MTREKNDRRYFANPVLPFFDGGNGTLLMKVWYSIVSADTRTPSTPLSPRPGGLNERRTAGTRRGAIFRARITGDAHILFLRRV